MSKVICDVCGTAYAETADQCPICGTAKTIDTRPAPGTAGEGSGYAYVKGGRFSQSNVRKKNAGKQQLPRTVEQPRPRRTQENTQQEEKQQRPPRKPRRDEPENEQPSNIGLIIIVVVLLLAIISLCAYVAIRFINMNNSRKANEATATSSSSSVLQNIPCTGISIPGAPSYTMTDLSDQVVIEVVCQPSDTTDMLNWNYDDSVVDVSRSGNSWIIKPVGSGETTVEVSCGGYSASVTIVCNIQNVPCNGIAIEGAEEHIFTSATEQLRLNVVCDPASTTEAVSWDYDENIVSIAQDGDQWVVIPVASGETTATVTCGGYSDSIHIVCDLNSGFVLKWAVEPGADGSYDITLKGYGTRWRIYNGEVDVSRISFSSSDETVATVENGYVYIWKNGNVIITAAYGNQVIRMTVRAREVEEQVTPVEPDYFIYTQYGQETDNDVTIYVGDVLRFSLRDKDGIKVTEGLTFRVSDDTVLSVSEDGRVTALSAGRAYIYIEYQGVEYKCVIRVHER